MDLVSLGRQSVYPRVYLVSYRGTSLAMETMQIAQRTRSGACSYWMGADRGIFYSIFSGQRTCLGSCIHCYAYRKIFVKFLEASKEKLGGAIDSLSIAEISLLIM